MKNFKILRNYLNLTQDELSKKINVSSNIISNYETGSAVPSFQSFLKLTELFEISLDFFILDDECKYPRNLKLLHLAKQLDDFSQPESRNHIEVTAKNFLSKKNKENISIKQDFIDVTLTNSFNNNLKIIRNNTNLSQYKLGESINTSGPAIAMYEKNTYPSIEKLIKLSKELNISSHFLSTGVKLLFNFTDGHFGKTMLLADNLLTLEEHKILIILMETIIKNTQS